ncbi:MAG TPA: hypothetical protein VKC54_02540 [Patescibacteria group bacterium]|nr:hypothetical protein [Patescibacteria group bacterium]
MKNQKGNALIWLLVLAVIALVAWYFMKNNYKLPVVGPTVMTTKDFDVAVKDLDSTDLNQMDSGLNGVKSDSSSF